MLDNVDAILLKRVQQGLRWASQAGNWAIEEMPIHPLNLLGLHQLDIL